MTITDPNTHAHTHSNLVADLLYARLNVQPLDWPATTPSSLPAAYSAALAVRAERRVAGEVAVGYKVGFTNRNIWPRYDVYAPIWGTVWQSGLSQRDPESQKASVVSLEGLSEPRIEPEVVFCLRSAPPPDCTLAELVGAISSVAHGFEVVHTHFPGWKFTAAQAVADAGLHGRLLLGHQVSLPTDLSPEAFMNAMAGLRVKLFCDGVQKDQGVGANVLDGPLQALHHFVKELRATPNAPALKAGDLITTGTLTDAYPVEAGQTWHTELDSAEPVAAELQGLAVRFE